MVYDLSVLKDCKAITMKQINKKDKLKAKIKLKFLRIIAILQALVKPLSTKANASLNHEIHILFGVGVKCKNSKNEP